MLFLVPSISLLNQTLVEWSTQSKYKYRVYAICSDPKASKASDSIDNITDLVIPATTDVNKLIARYVSEDADDTLNFFFSTYQSIEVVAAFQKKSGINFNIIICDIQPICHLFFFSHHDFFVFRVQRYKKFFIYASVRGNVRDFYSIFVNFYTFASRNQRQPKLPLIFRL